MYVFHWILFFHLLTRLLDGQSAATTASTFAIAYAVHKLLMPIRLAFTASILPWVVRRFNIQLPEVKDDDDDVTPSSISK